MTEGDGGQIRKGMREERTEVRPDGWGDAGRQKCPPHPYAGCRRMTVGDGGQIRKGVWEE